MRFDWNDDIYGHIISVEYSEMHKKFYGNGIRIYDPQTGDYDISPTYYIMRAHNFQLMRVDNLEFNYKYVDNILKGE